MWIISKTGFISVVELRDDPSTLLVRARVSDDIEAAFPDAEVFEDAKADYRWRAEVPRNVVAAFVAGQVMEVDYTSHAKEAMSEGDAGRHAAYMGVWRELNRLQVRDLGGPVADYGDWPLDGGDADALVACVNAGELEVRPGATWEDVVDKVEDHLWENGFPVYIYDDGEVYDEEPDEPMAASIGVKIVDTGSGGIVALRVGTDGEELDDDEDEDLDAEIDDGINLGGVLANLEGGLVPAYGRRGFGRTFGTTEGFSDSGLFSTFGRDRHTSIEIAVASPTEIFKSPPKKTSKKAAKSSPKNRR